MYPIFSIFFRPFNRQIIYLELSPMQLKLCLADNFKWVKITYIKHVKF